MIDTIESYKYFYSNFWPDSVSAGMLKNTFRKPVWPLKLRALPSSLVVARESH